MNETIHIWWSELNYYLTKFACTTVDELIQVGNNQGIDIKII